MFKQLYSNLHTGKDWYHTYKREITLATKIRLKNKLLYDELEQACTRRAGVLTYAEYLTIDQFGENGFYATSNRHGKTDVDTRWSKALATYCQKNGYETIIEFGCGTGELGAATAKAYQRRTQRELNWIGVEIDTNIHTEIVDNFISHGVRTSLIKIATISEEIEPISNPLILFPYSLDNIPPQIFLNTKSNTSYPNALLGITVKNGTISEVIIPQDILAKKGITLSHGLFTQNKNIYNLTRWRLKKGQRAYVPIDSFTTLNTYAKKFRDNPSVIIIDEVRKEPWSFSFENLGVPKSLYEKNLVCNDRIRYYRESGKHNLYYPLYKDTLIKFLSTIGFRSIEYEVEQEKAAQLNKKLHIPMKEGYTTYAFFAKNYRDKKNATLPIIFNPQRIW